MKIVLTAAAAALLATIAADGASAGQRPCQDRSQILEKLARDYKEAPVAIGMAANGGVLEVLTTPEGADVRTFTIIVTMPNGKSCLLASGENFEMFDAVETARRGDPA